MGKSVVLLVALVGFCALHARGQQQAVAVFNAKGVSGRVTFTEVEGGIRVQADLQGLVGDHQWHVHLYPIDQTLDPNVQCTGNYVGPHYDPFNRNNDSTHGHGADMSAYQARCAQDSTMCEAGDLSGKLGLISRSGEVDKVDNSSSLFLRGRFSIIGRSLVIHEANQHANNFECATIRSMAEYSGSPVVVLQSTFVYPIAGVMYFRQVEGEDVQMWGKMYWVDGRDGSMDHNWHIHQRAPGEEFRMGECNTRGNIGGHYTPFGRNASSTNYNMECGPAMLQGCEVGDLTGKHDTINVAGSPSPYVNQAFFFTDSFLNLTGENPVIDRSIAIHQANRGPPVVACAPLLASETIVLTQQQEEEITISQTSPFEDTVIASSAPREMAVIQNSALAPLALSCAPSPSLIFNEYGLPPQENSDTPDRFLTGDLNSRYPQVNRVLEGDRVFDLPVYGANSSISSLHIRTARDSLNNCSALTVSLVGSNVIVARAAFKGNLRGAVYFIQRDYGDGSQGSDRFGNTFVIVDVYRTSTQDVSTGHVWRVVTGAAATSCSNSPIVFNPYSINTTGDTGCSPQAQLRCASGDLSGKHGNVNIGSDTVDRPTYTFVDNNVLLTGSFSVVGNSVAVWSGSNVLDCASVVRTFVSKETYSITAPRESGTTRTFVAEVLADLIEADTSDILFLNIRTTEPFGLQCTEVTVRVLGDSQATADGRVQMLQDKKSSVTNKIRCGAMRSAAVSLLALAVPMIIALFHLVFKN